MEDKVATGYFEAINGVRLIANLVFYSGAALFALYIKKTYKLTNKETALTMFGFGPTKLSWKINLLVLLFVTVISWVILSTYVTFK